MSKEIKIFKSNIDNVDVFGAIDIVKKDVTGIFKMYVNKQISRKVFEFALVKATVRVINPIFTMAIMKHIVILGDKHKIDISLKEENNG